MAGGGLSMAFQQGLAPQSAARINDFSTQGPAASSHSAPPTGRAHAPGTPAVSAAGPTGKKKSRRNADPSTQKRRCVSTACVACRKRKSKCDGALPSCAACSSVYSTECIYDPNSDHRRKGVYREKVDSMKAQSSTLQILIEAILNASEEDVPAIVKKIRTCDSLDEVAESIAKGEFAEQNEADDDDADLLDTSLMGSGQPVEGEFELARKMGELRLENGSVRFIGGTSHLIYTGDLSHPGDSGPGTGDLGASLGANREGAVAVQVESQFEPPYATAEEALNSWTTVTNDTSLIIHLMNMYFNWHYTYFTTLSKSLFYRDFLRGRPRVPPKRTVYCTSLLVNAMLTLGCHFTSVPGAFAVPGDTRTKGDHFFAEAKRLIVENDEYEKPKLATVEALAIMSVREAGCAREAKGWVYSGMAFRMAQDIGLNFDDASSGSRPALGADSDPGRHQMSEGEVDARRITFWGCFLFDKAWSNYLGRLPQLPKNSYSVPKYDVFPDEDAELWSPYTDSGFDMSLRQPSRTRAIGLQLSKLCEISSDLLLFFYHPNHIGRSSGKAVELKKLSELHRRLEDWRRELPKEFEPKEGQLPNVILTHMFFHLQYIHLFRPFLKYSPAASPLPAHVSPRRICTANAGAISKLMRLYKKTYNLRQICNIAVYMVHSACTIHLLNLPEKTAKRNIIHGVKQLEEMADDWLCARRSLGIISVLARKWGVELPEEASQALQHSDEKYGTFSTADVPSPDPTAAAATLSGTHSNADPTRLIPGVELSPGSAPQAVDVKSEQYGPGGITTASMPGIFDQYAQASPSYAHDFTTPGVTPEYVRSVPRASSHTSEPVDSAPSQIPVSQANGGNDGAGSAVSIGGGLSPVNAWSLPPSVSQSMHGYQHPHMEFPQTTRPGEKRPSAYGMDEPDWFLKEGASWHNNFETWGLAQQQPAAPVSPHRPQQAHHPYTTHSSGTPTSTSNDNTPISDNALYQFRGPRNQDLDMTFDDLGNLGGNLDGL